MKFIAKIYEDTSIDGTCGFIGRTMKETSEWANQMIDEYAMAYDGGVMERSPNLYIMEAEMKVIKIVISVEIDVK